MIREMGIDVIISGCVGVRGWGVSVLVLFSPDSSQDTGAAGASRIVRSRRVIAVTSMLCVYKRIQSSRAREGKMVCHAGFGPIYLIHLCFCAVLHIYMSSMNSEIIV